MKNNFQIHLEAIQKKKWIKGAIEHPGALRKKLGKKEGEKITKADIAKEKKKIAADGKVSASEKTEQKQLNLANTLMSMRKKKKSK